MRTTDPDTDDLIDLAADGDPSARGRLLDRHRQQLRRMVALRLDRRMAARVDPSDVVQDALADADRKLDDYLDRRPVPFYLWLRQITWEQIIKTHQRHTARKRTVAGAMLHLAPEQKGNPLSAIFSATTSKHQKHPILTSF